MIPKPYLFLLFFLLTFLAAFSGSKPFPGYYIDNNGDSVLCTVKFYDWHINPKTIIVNVKNSTLTLSPTEMKGFGVFWYSDYKSAKVSYHNSKISGLNLPEEFSESIKTQDCFLKLSVKGKYSLYELVQPERYYYFING
jgi:hypothetical protein